MKSFQLILFVVCLVGGSVLAAQIQEQEPKRPVTRAKRPSFEKKDWSGVFFEDVFSEGLTGQRPSQASPNVASQSSDNTTEAVTTGSWSALIDGFVIENEVKRWQQELAGQVTTPIKFKTTHQEISEQFSMLAMWFAIIGQYQGDVRWKEESNSVRTAFVDAAVKSRQTDMSAFNNVKQRTEDLAELVRGGKFPEEPDADGEISDWSMVVDRNPIMTRLELSVSEELKQPTSSEKDFKDNIDLIIHEASLIAAMGRVLQLPEMLDADDDDYKAYSEEMLAAAQEMKNAARENSLERVNVALNKINQACTNCHGDFR